jgi:hypothetical protein
MTGKKIYDYDLFLKSIIEYKIVHLGDSPTIRTIAEVTGVKSTSHVQNILKKLHKEGKIKYGHIPGHIQIIGSRWIQPKRIGQQ